MAVVYRAHDDHLDRRVAPKVLAPDLARDEAFRARFIQESRIAAAAEHPNIIPVFSAGDVVTAQLAAEQTNGTVKTYQGSYTVEGGVITQFSVQQVS
jgi:serine/threonine protein kinase